METLQEQKQQTLSEQHSLRSTVTEAIHTYFDKLGNQAVVNLYEMFLAEVEEPLLRAVMENTRNNQSKAAIILGLSRGTLRKKLKQYELI